MRHAFISLVLLAGLIVNVGYTQTVILNSHPRIYVTGEALPDIQRRCREEYKSIYQDFLSSRWILDQSPGVGYSHMTNMMLPAFLYLIEGEIQYADKTKEYLDALSRNPPRDQYLTPEYIRAAAACYDWIYDQLSQAEKERYARAFVDMGNYTLSLWRHSDFNNHFVNETVAVIYIGVVLSGDGVDDRAADRFLEIGETYLKDHAIPASNEIAGDDGGQAEGFSYNDWGYALPLALTSEMWRTAAGEDLFDDTTFFHTQARWHLYCQRPHDGAYVKSEDCPSGIKPGENLKSFIHLIAARTGDPLAQWVGDQIQWNYKQKIWREILFRDPQLDPMPPDSLPLAHHFKKLGWVATRSGWNSPDDAFALFQCGDFFAGHQHLDANAFVIHKAGSLAIDSGVNEYSAHRANYYARTIAHNSLLVFDPHEQFSDAVWSAQGIGGSNDGGQLRGSITDRVGLFEEDGSYDIADIIQYKQSPNFTYACGDASRAYNPDKLESFTRQFVHIQPDLFVIFDRVVSKNPSFKKTWLLHSIEKPIQNGSQFTIRQNRGMLLCWTLLPKSFQAELIGGPGKEFWVNGKNYPPDTKSDSESGSWRIEISPHKENTEDLFLHVLQAGLSSNFTPVNIFHVSDDIWTGVDLAYDDILTQVRFAKSGTQKYNIHIQKKGQTIEHVHVPNSPLSITPAAVHQ